MIANLPDEILRHILIFLEPAEILVNIARSSKHLASISSSDNFWRFKYIPQLFSFPPSIIQVQVSGLCTGLTMAQLQQCCVVSYKRQMCSDWLVSDWDDWYMKTFGTNRDSDTDTDTNFDIYINTDHYVWPRASILPTIEDAVLELRTGDSCCCLCSSRDRDGGEEILENVLPLNDVVAATDDWKSIASGNSTNIDHSRQGVRWWSSAPSPSNRPEDTNEVILFTTKVKAIITDIAIKPLQDPFSSYGKNTFSWPRISIKIYSLPTPTSMSKPHNGSNDTQRERPGCGEFRITKDMLESADIGSSFDTRRSTDRRLDQRAIIEAVLGSHTPVYESPLINVTSSNSTKEHDDSWQYYNIPDGVVGNVITFTLWGKNCEQYIGSGYYVCVERVAARGIPLLQR